MSIPISKFVETPTEHQKLQEPLFAYRFKDGLHDGKTLIEDTTQLHAYIARNHIEYSEMRFTDMMDCMVMHVLHHNLVFPKL